jgi:hypothetical protein
VPSPEAIGETVCDAVDRFRARPRAEQTAEAWDALVERLHAQLVAPDQGVGLAGLLWVLRARRRLAYQHAVGTILVRFRPTCPHPLAELMDLVVECGDAGAHLLAEWLAVVFGKATVLEAARTRWASGLLSRQEQRRIEALAWALGEGPETFGR